MHIKFWGVRGSIPTSYTPQGWHKHFNEVANKIISTGQADPKQLAQHLQTLGVTSVGGYGTATTCVEVQSPHTQLIIDGGTGIRTLSEAILSGKHGSPRGPFHIFMTHFHWDHVIGLPFFIPHFMKGVHIHYYAVQPDLEKNIREVFKKPFFPVEFDSLPSKIHFHVIEPRRPLVIDDLTLTPYMLDHPDPCWGLKIQHKDKTYSHCVDTEGTRVTAEELGPDLPLYQNVDAMFFDAQYTYPELSEKSNWGHSASQVGLWIAIREGIKNIYFAHHDPGATIEHIDDLKIQTKEFMDSRMQIAKENGENIPDINWDFAYEGLEIKL